MTISLSYLAASLLSIFTGGWIAKLRAEVVKLKAEAAKLKTEAKSVVSAVESRVSVDITKLKNLL